MSIPVLALISSISVLLKAEETSNVPTEIDLELIFGPITPA
jgi:hypothetical protein